MENNKNQIIIILLLIFTLLFVLIYSCIEVLGKKDVTVTAMLNEKVQDVKEITNKKIVVETENYNMIATEQKEQILEELKTQSVLYEEPVEEPNPQIDVSRFYYSKIDANAKIIYDKLFENRENLKKGNFKIEYGNIFTETLKQEEGAESLKKSYTQAMRAFLFDNPEIFFLDVPKLCMVTQTKTSMMTKEYNVSIAPEEGRSYLNRYFPTEAIINSAQNDINEEVNKILSVTENLNAIQKIEYVHNYLIDNIEYDSTIEKANIHDIYGALINKVAVCEGYAKSFKYILDKMQIPSIIVVGNAKNSIGEIESHSWNYVNVDGKWYGIDVTFDDPIIVGDTNGAITNFKYRYFLKGNLEFSKIHTINPIEILEFEVEYPILEEENYN